MTAGKTTAAIAVLLAVAACNRARGPTPVHYEHAEVQQVIGVLDDADEVSGHPIDARVHALLYEIPPTTPAVAPLSIRATRNSRLSPIPPIGPSDALSRPGLYLGVLKPVQVGPGQVDWQVAWLVPIADPREAIGEGWAGGDEIAGGAYETTEGTVAARFPFIAEGKVFLYEAIPTPSGSTTQKVHFVVDLLEDRFSTEWQEFEVEVK